MTRAQKILRFSIMAFIAGVVLLLIIFAYGLAQAYEKQKIAEQRLGIKLGSPYVTIDGVSREMAVFENVKINGAGYKAGLREGDRIIDIVFPGSDQNQQQARTRRIRKSIPALGHELYNLINLQGGFVDVNRPLDPASNNYETTEVRVVF